MQLVLFSGFSEYELPPASLRSSTPLVNEGGKYALFHLFLFFRKAAVLLSRF